MKWVICLLIIFFLPSLHGVTITIGSGQVNNVPLPVNAYYNYSYSQVVYLQSEIQHAGVIQQISYPYHIVSSDFLLHVNHLKIYMGMVSRASFQSNTDWIPLDSLQLVFDGDWDISNFSGPLPGDGWVSIPLSSYFSYDNIHHLVIAFDENQAGHSLMSDKFLCTSATGARGLECHSDIADIDPLTPSAVGSAYLRSYIANTRLEMITDFAAPVNPYPVNDQEDVELVPHFSWACSAESYEMFMGTEPDQLVLQADSLVTNSWAVSGILQTNTTYYWQVKAHYGPQCVDSEVWQFTTGILVGIALPFQECFDLNMFPPDQWQRMEGLFQQGTSLIPTSHGWIWGYYGNQPDSMNGAARLNIYGRDCYHWLLSPMISGTPGTSAQLSFRTRLTNWNSNSQGMLGTDDRIRVVLFPNASLSLQDAVVLREWVASDSIGQVVEILFTIPGMPFRVGFYGESTVSDQDNDLFLDNIRLIADESAWMESPVNLSAAIEGNAVQLNWEAPESYVPLGYKIYRNYHYLRNCQQTTFTDSNVNQGQVYSYFITALNTGGQESPPCNSASLICVFVNSPVLNDSFEAYQPFASPSSPWTCIDADHHSTFGLDDTTFPGEGEASSFVVFNPQECTPSFSGMHAAEGSQFLAVFPATPPPNDDWLVTPRMHLGSGSMLSFKARSLNTDYGAERFRVAVSMTAAIPDSFTMISSEPFVQAPNQWTSYTYDLSGYDGMEIYIAIQCVSYDCCMFGLDEFKVISQGGYVGNGEHIAVPESHVVSVYPNPFRNACTIQWNGEREEKTTVAIFNIRGQKVIEFSRVRDTTLEWDGRDERGKLVGSGVYIVKVKTGVKVITGKIVKL